MANDCAHCVAQANPTRVPQSYLSWPRTRRCWMLEDVAIYIYKYAYVYLYIHVFVYIYIHIDVSN